MGYFQWLLIEKRREGEGVDAILARNPDQLSAPVTLE